MQPSNLEFKKTSSHIPRTLIIDQSQLMQQVLSFTSRIDDFPNELLIEIFKNLNFCDWSQSFLVCQRWAKLVLLSMVITIIIYFIYYTAYAIVSFVSDCHIKIFKKCILVDLT